MSKPSFCPMQSCQYLASKPNHGQYKDGYGTICVGFCPNITTTYNVVHPNTHNFCFWTDTGWSKLQLNQVDAEAMIELLKLVKTKEGMLR